MKKVFAAVILLSVATSVSGCSTAHKVWGKMTGSSTASAAAPAAATPAAPAAGGAEAAKQ